MLYTNLNEIKDKSQILNAYANDQNPLSILTSYNLTLSELLAILHFYKVPINQLLSLPSLYSVSSSAIIIIGDTHLGSQRENLNYLKYVYQLAAAKHITTILHVGDIVQSTLGYPKKAYLNPLNQLNHLVQTFPSASSITTYFLLGNHDFHFLRKNACYLEFLKERSDFRLLGTAKSYLTWQNNLVSLTHQVSKNHLVIPNLPNLITFIGHRHSLKIYNNSAIAVPTLSDDLKYYEDDEINNPGFLLATLNNGLLNITLYSFQQEEVSQRLFFQRPTL